MSSGYGSSWADSFYERKKINYLDLNYQLKKMGCENNNIVNKWNEAKVVRAEERSINAVHAIFTMPNCFDFYWLATLRGHLMVLNDTTKLLENACGLAQCVITVQTFNK